MPRPATIHEPVTMPRPASIPRPAAVRRGASSLMVGMVLALSAVLAGDRAAAQGYTSPFSITLDADIAAWTSDFAARQAALDANTTPAKGDWYSPTTSYAALPYGPLNPQLYSSASIGSPADATRLEYDRGQPVTGVAINASPVGVDPLAWQRQRVMAAANVLLQAGTPYQHLHLPSFDPALVPGSGFTWLPVSDNASLQTSWQLANGVPGTTPNPYQTDYGRATAGIDCTDFTAWTYNLGLGIQMHSGTPTQVEFVGAATPQPGGTAKATVLDSQGIPLAPQFFYGPNFGTHALNAPGSLDGLMASFQTGDLLYMGDPTLGLLHVVMWLGQTATDTYGNTFPLVISSHDNTPAIFDTLGLDAQGLPLDGDITGHLPPPGVHILPFAPSNWFYQDFQIAMRVIGVASVPEIDPAGAGAVLALVGGVLSLVERRRRRA